jgi:hypothetical protein
MRQCECVTWKTDEVGPERGPFYCHEIATCVLWFRDKWCYYCATHYDQIVACIKRRAADDDPSNPRRAGSQELVEINNL